MARWTDCEGFHRRDFLKVGAAGLLGLTLPQLLRLEAQAGRRPTTPPGRARPSPSSWSGWAAARPPSTCGTSSPTPPKASAASSSRSTPTPTASRSPSTCPRWPASIDKATIVRSLAHTIPSHGPATVFMTTGNKPTPALQYPALGSLATKLLPADKRRAAVRHLQRAAQRLARAQAGYLGTAYNPFIVEGAPAARRRQAARARRQPSASAASRCRPASPWKNSKTATSCCAGFDNDLPERSTNRRPGRRPRRLPPAGPGNPALRQDPEGLRPGPGSRQALRDSYGSTPFGQGALAARRLIEAGVRFVTVSLGGWDTHGQELREPARPACCRSSIRRCRP